MNNNWEDYKKIYKSVQIPEESINMQWEAILHRLPEQKKHEYAYYFRSAAVFAAIVLLLCAGIVGASQKAQPGQALYSIKQFTNNLGINRITRPESSIEKKQTPVIKAPTPTASPSPRIEQSPAEDSVRIKQDVKGAHIENVQQENSHSAANNGVKHQEEANPSSKNGNSSSNQSGNQNQGNQGKSDESHSNSDSAHANDSSSNGKGNGSGKDK